MSDFATTLTEKATMLVNIFPYLSNLFALITFVVILILLRNKSLTREIWWFCLYLGALTLMELSMAIMDWLDKTSFWIGDLFLPIEYFLLAMLFGQWHENPTVKKFLWLSIPAYWAVYLLLHFSGWEQFSPTAINLYSGPFFFCIAGFFGLYTILKPWLDGQETHPHRGWILSGLILYYLPAGVIFTSLFLEMLDNLEIIYLLNAGNGLLTIVKNICFIAGILVYARNRKKIG